MAAKCKVYKKASSNNCLNVYLTHRDFLEDQGRPLVPVAGVVQFSEELLKEDKIFCLVNMTYRYGRESDEAMVHTFKRTVQLINAPINISSEVKSEEQQVNENHIQGEVCGKGKLAKILHYDEEKEMELTTVIIPERPRREKVIRGNNETSSDKCMDAGQTQSNEENAAVDQQSDKVGCSKEKETDVVQSEATTDVPSSKPNEDGSDQKEEGACKNIEKNDSPNQEGTCDEMTQKSKETIEGQGQDPSQASDENKQNGSETTAENEQNSEGQPQADQQKASDPSENPSASDGTEADTAASENDVKTEEEIKKDEETKSDEESKNEEAKKEEEVKDENSTEKNDDTENKEEIKKENGKTEGENSEEEKKEENCETDNNASEQKESGEGNSCNSEEKQPEITTQEKCDSQTDSGRGADALNPETQGPGETADKDLNDAKKPDSEAHNSVEVSQEEKQEKEVDGDKNVETETDHNTETETGTAKETESSTKKDSDTNQNESEGVEESSQENCDRGGSTTPSSTNNTLGKNKKSDAGKESGKSSPSESRSGAQTSIPNSKSSTLKLPSSNSTTSTLKRENNGDACVEDSKSSPVSPSKSNADPDRGSEENGAATDVKEWNDAVDEISDALDRKSVQEDPNESVAKLAEHRSRAIESHPLQDKIILSRRHYLLPVPTRDQLETLTPHRDCTEVENSTPVESEYKNDDSPPATVTEETLTPKPDSAGQTPEQQNEGGGSESKENSEEQNSEAKTKTDLNQRKPASDSKKENVGTVCHDVRPLQERLIEKLQSQRETERCVPFSVSIPAAAPNSVALVPGPQQSVREPVGVIYELQVYAAKEAMEEPAKYKSTSFAVRKLQLPPPGMASKTPNNMTSSKTFKCSPGEISLSVSLNKEIYSHLEEIETVVNLDNRSKKTVKTIVCEVVQNVSIDMTNTTFSRVVTTLESRDGCPVLPNYKIEKKFSLMPDVRYNKANSGVAILGLLRDADCQLASSTLHLTENSLDRDLGVLVSYSVRVSLTFGSLSALLSVEHPMQLLPSRSEEYNDTAGKTDVLQKLKGIGDTSKICIEEFALLRKLKSLDETNDP